MTTEEERIASAQQAGRNVAGYEVRSGHTEPRDWDKDGQHNAGVFSHLAALGFSRIGTRMYSQTFVDAYRAEFERLVTESEPDQRYYWDEPEIGDDPPFGADTARIIDQEAGGVIAYVHKLTAPLLVRTLNENPFPKL